LASQLTDDDVEGGLSTGNRVIFDHYSFTVEWFWT